MRGQGSASFDAEGVATRDRDLIRGGVLERYVLGSYSARKLGLQSTGNAGGIHNLVVKTGDDDFAAMLKKLGTGLVVTDVMGQGVSIITGDYSRGASGFWVENGAIVHPVEEITIAANLRDMFARHRGDRRRRRSAFAHPDRFDPDRQNDDRRRIDRWSCLMRARMPAPFFIGQPGERDECSAE